eukprot:TRINITY_DN125421_c0_g1_i1.p2 TRINITY_DN125421_c0_g1~~TRINITY_DN125421_c0_g1_i1.p2  ORF type:complete len:196 (-),score=28.24 TRINITY_DN125421_c0_g1_i1:89-625(-)
MAAAGKFRVGLEKTLPRGVNRGDPRTVPRGGADDLYGRYFAEVTLDVVEEQTFQRRTLEEVGPRHVHLRQNSLGEVTIPPHLEENLHGYMTQQLWTGNPKVDRTLFIRDRQLEAHARCLKDLALQRHVPALRSSSLARKNFGSKLGPRPFDDSFRSIVLNSARRAPLPLQGIDRHEYP